MLALLKIKDVIRLDRKNYRSKTRKKAYVVISCRLSGESCFLYSGKQMTVKRGDLLYIPQGCSYSQETAAETIICLHLEALSPLPCDLQKITPTDPDEMCRLFEKCYDFFSKKDENYEHRCMSVLYEILSCVSLSESNHNGGELFSSAMLYLDAHIFDCNFSVEQLCDEVNISRTYFNKIFKERLGVTPTVYINQKRIEKAKFLLQSGDYSASEIALLCGFNDVKYFYVVFKKETGQTTLAFKKACTLKTSAF